jgi:hypothetical protein
MSDSKTFEEVFIPIVLETQSATGLGHVQSHFARFSDEAAHRSEVTQPVPLVIRDRDKENAPLECSVYMKHSILRILDPLDDPCSNHD